MGDRTHVTITIRASDYAANKKFFDEVEPETVNPDDMTVIIEQSDVNYGEWGEVEDFLRLNEIEYDKTWGSGSEYDAGSSYARKILVGDQPVYQQYEIYSTQEAVLEELDELKTLFEQDVQKGMEALNKRIKELYPWEAKSLKEPNSVRFIKEA